MNVNEEDRIGEEGQGFRYLLDSLNLKNFNRAEALGIGKNVLKRATQYAKERIVFDRPIGKTKVFNIH